MGDRLRVLAWIDGSSVTGPAKNLIGFALRAREMEGLGAEVRIGLIVRGDPESNALVHAVRRSGLPLEVVSERRAFDLAVVPGLRAAFDRFRPHILQTHNYKSHFLVRYSGLHRQAPWLAFHHGYTTTSFRVRVYNELDRWSLRGAARVVTVCRPFALELQRKGVPLSRISIQHNSIPPFVAPTAAEAAALKAGFGISADRRVVLAIGRLSREKAQRDLIGALAALKRDKPSEPIAAILVGDGPERENLVQLSAELGLNQIVIFAGQQPDVRPYYAIADVFVLPSHTEGSPNVLLEAMAAGKPIVACNVGGVPEIARHGETALLIERGRIDAMSSAIGRLLEDRDLASRLGDAAGKASAAYSPEAYCQSILGIYRRVTVS